MKLAPGPACGLRNNMANRSNRIALNISALVSLYHLSFFMLDVSPPSKENLEEVPAGRPPVEPGDLRPDGTVEERL